MSAEYIIREKSLIVTKAGEALTDETNTIVEIEDEGCGEFVIVRHGDSNAIRIDPDEWQTLRKAIDRMVKECKG